MIVWILDLMITSSELLDIDPAFIDLIGEMQVNGPFFINVKI